MSAAAGAGGDYLVDDSLTNLMATVLDFQTQTSAVVRALDHFASRVLGRRLTYNDVVAVVVAAAGRLGRPAHRLPEDLRRQHR